MPAAWSGMLRVPPDSLSGELGIVRTPFYDVLYSVAFVGAAAVAALVLPPDGRSVTLVVTIAVIYGAVAVAMARFERQ